MTSGNEQQDNQVFMDFDEVANWFVEINTRFSPAEYHGALVGALAGGMRLQPAEWQGFLYAVMGYDPTAVSAEQRDAHASIMASQAAATLDALSSDEMAFQLILPDDEYELSQRTEAVSVWCKGFLGGFAEAQLYRKRAGMTLPDEYPENVLEAIRDMTEIARATADSEPADDHEGESSLDDPLLDDFSAIPSGEAYGEADEKDYLEITEYVRLAVLTIFTEYGWVEVHEPAAQPPAGEKPVLH